MRNFVLSNYENNKPINQYFTQMNHFLRLSAGTLAAIALTACVDDKYDLSDIDTTVQVEVNDLTLPVNIDPFTMSSIF